MSVFAFILAIIAAVVFLFVGDAAINTRFAGRSAVALGLFFLTVALIVQFCARSHTVTF